MASNQGPPKFIRYVPAQKGAQPRIISMVEVQKDPMDPKNFKLNKKIPRPPPSPPAPVLHSPPRKVTSEELSKWNIPPCVSSFKNPRGYTLALDKRCAFNGRDSAYPEITNPKPAQLSETLAIATRQHEEQLREIIKNEKLMAQKEKERNEEILRQRAQQAREERAAMKRGIGHSRADSDDEDIDSEEERERRRIREDRHRERVRNVNIKSSAPDRRTKLDRQRDRDISEQVALGTARPNTLDTDVHDQRLYNQSQGISSGFGEEDDYAVYEKPWKSKESFSKNYRPSESILNELNETKDEEDDLATTSKPTQDEDEPIQFEKEEEEDDDDPLSLQSILANIRKDPKKAMQQVGNSSKRHKS